jgi:uncharacterized protein YuzE
MDSAIVRLMETRHLKTKLWHEAAQSRARPAFSYNPDADVLMLLFVDPQRLKVTHYLDEHIALLYLRDSGEIIGMRIEAFKTLFLPRYVELKMAWVLKRSCEGSEDVSDLGMVIEKQEQVLAKEISRIARPIVEHAGVKMPAFA